MLQLYPFDCLLIDIQMPDMDGMEVVRRIRANMLGDIEPSEQSRRMVHEILPGVPLFRQAVPRDLVTVVVSAHTMQGDRERFLRGGMDYYISKPVIFKELSALFSGIGTRLKGRGGGDRTAGP